jgi:hypothetical protein
MIHTRMIYIYDIRSPRGKRTHTVMLVKHLHHNIHATHFECCFFSPLSPIPPVFTSYFSLFVCAPSYIYTQIKHISDELGTQHRIECLQVTVSTIRRYRFFRKFFWRRT